MHFVRCRVFSLTIFCDLIESLTELGLTEVPCSVGILFHPNSTVRHWRALPRRVERRMELFQKVAPALISFISKHQKVVHVSSNSSKNLHLASDGVLLLEHPNGWIHLQTWQLESLQGTIDVMVKFFGCHSQPVSCLEKLYCTSCRHEVLRLAGQISDVWPGYLRSAGTLPWHLIWVQTIPCGFQVVEGIGVPSLTEYIRLLTSSAPRSGSVKPTITNLAFALTTLGSSVPINTRTHLIRMRRSGGTSPTAALHTLAAGHSLISLPLASFMAARCVSLKRCQDTSTLFASFFATKREGSFTIDLHSASVSGVGKSLHRRSAPSAPGKLHSSLSLHPPAWPHRHPLNCPVPKTPPAKGLSESSCFFRAWRKSGWR